jgi:hypothetical protein
MNHVNYDHVRTIVRRLRNQGCRYLDATDRRTVTNVRQFAVLVKGRTAHLCPVPRSAGALIPLEKKNNGHLELCKRTVGGEVMDGRAPGTTIIDRLLTYNSEFQRGNAGVITHYVDLWNTEDSEDLLKPVIHDINE